MTNEKRMISLDEALKATHNEIFWTESQQAAVRSFLVQLPKADAVELVHGRWAAIDDDCEELEGEEEAKRWGCSACREIVEYDDWTHRSLLTRYCPNCGAKMDGDGNA